MTAMIEVKLEKLHELSEREITEVSGGLLNVAGGAGIGAGTYLIYSGITGEFSWSGLVGATVMGGVTSGFSALGAGAAYSAGVGALTGGAAHNAATHWQNLMQE